MYLGSGVGRLDQYHFGDKPKLQSKAVGRSEITSPRPDVIRRKRAVFFCHRRLADIIAGETFRSVSSSKRRERFAGVNQPWRSDWFDSGSPTYMASGVIGAAGDRIVEFVNRPGV